MGNARLCEGLKPVSVWWERNRPPRCTDYPLWPPCPQEANKAPNYWNSRFLELPWFDRVILQPPERQLFAKIVWKIKTVSPIPPWRPFWSSFRGPEKFLWTKDCGKRTRHCLLRVTEFKEKGGRIWCSLDIYMGTLVQVNINRALFARDTSSVLFSTKEESGCNLVSAAK